MASWWESFGNPLGWLAALSELGAGFSAYSGYRQQQKAYQRQREQMAQLVAESQRQRGELTRAAQAPITAEPYYAPMTEAERRALERQIKAELITRGLPPDSSYTSALTAELMAKTESDRYLRSLDLAGGQRRDVLRAMAPGDVLGSMQAQASLTPPPTPQIGQPGALGRYLAYSKLLQAIKGTRRPSAEPGQMRIPMGTGPSEIYTGERYGWTPAPAAGAAWPATPYEGSPYGSLETDAGFYE